MIVTEKEAFGIRCCGPEGCGRDVLEDTQDGPAYVTIPAGLVDAVASTRYRWRSYCEGSKCMGWVWVYDDKGSCGHIVK